MTEIKRTTIVQLINLINALVYVHSLFSDILAAVIKGSILPWPSERDNHHHHHPPPQCTSHRGGSEAAPANPLNGTIIV
jgi:hypothetical protein